MNLGIYSIIIAELRADVHVSQLAWSLGTHRYECSWIRKL
ncbi:hypothetical protein LINGRAHAP2_LOCUS21372 [Linum grandiflorum]